MLDYRVILIYLFWTKVPYFLSMLILPFYCFSDALDDIIVLLPKRPLIPIYRKELEDVV